jgi:hypothetical protein
MRPLSDKRGRGAAAGQRAAANKLQARDSWAAIMRAVNDESLRPWEDGHRSPAQADPSGFGEGAATPVAGP